jgi:hypothetical protein
MVSSEMPEGSMSPAEPADIRRLNILGHRNKIIKRGF